MTTILILKTSVLGDASASNKLIDEAVSLVEARQDSVSILVRNLASEPIPHLTPHAAAAIRSAVPANDKEALALALSDQLIAELNAADTIIIGAPMYNFGMPSSLKSWFDHVLRAGVTFRYGDTGPEGLVTGKKAIVVLTRGGLYSEGPAQAMDSQEPHIRTLLNFIGVSDVNFVRAEKLAFGHDLRNQALNRARSEIGEALASRFAQAA